MQENNQQETKRSPGLCHRDLDPHWSHTAYCILYTVYYTVHQYVGSHRCWRVQTGLSCSVEVQVRLQTIQDVSKNINMLQKPKVSVEFLNLVTNDEICEAADV